MKDILFNLAMLDTLQFCKNYGVDPSGSHLVKDGRGYRYTLTRTETGKSIVSVVFKPRSVPEHYKGEELQ